MCEEGAMSRAKQKPKQKAKPEPKKRSRTRRWVLVAALVGVAGYGAYKWAMEAGLPIKADLQFVQAVAQRTTSKEGTSLIQYRLEVKALGLGNKMPEKTSLVVTVDGEPHPVQGMQSLAKGSPIFFIGAVPAKSGASEVEFKIEADDGDQGNNVKKVMVP